MFRSNFGPLSWVFFHFQKSIPFLATGLPEFASSFKSFSTFYSYFPHKKYTPKTKPVLTFENVAVLWNQGCQIWVIVLGSFRPPNVLPKNTYWQTLENRELLSEPLKSCITSVIKARSGPTSISTRKIENHLEIPVCIVHASNGSDVFLGQYMARTRMSVRCG